MQDERNIKQGAARFYAIFLPVWGCTGIRLNDTAGKMLKGVKLLKILVI
jgi:hypothetical protein